MGETTSSNTTDLYEKARKEFPYATCRLILDRLTKMGLDSLFDCSKEELEKNKLGEKTGMGLSNPLHLKPAAELILSQLVIQTKSHENFGSGSCDYKEVKDFIEAVEGLVSIFEPPPSYSI